MNISVTANNTHKCSGGCLYCSAARTMNYSLWARDLDILKKVDEENYGLWKRDWEKFDELLSHDRQYLAEMKKDPDKRFCHVDLWGADPVTNHLITIETVDHLREWADRNQIKLSISSSTNGLPLQRDDICEYYTKNDIKIQLSHDGIGQWIRTRDFDPMDISSIPTLFRSGILNAVNCTTSFYNNDMMKNHIYWLSRLVNIFPEVFNPAVTASREISDIYRRLYIKINHIYDSDYDLKAINTDGRYSDMTFDELKGKQLGDMAFRNEVNDYRDPILRELISHNLDDYLNSHRHLATLCLDPSINNDPKYLPFKSYILEQISRFRYIQPGQKTGACRSFQLWKHQIGDPREWSDQTFVIDSTGRYSECNLLDADTEVMSPGGLYVEECETCRWKNQSECNQCGSEKRREHCEYRWRWAQYLQEMLWMRACVEHAVKK